MPNGRDSHITMSSAKSVRALSTVMEARRLLQFDSDATHEEKAVGEDEEVESEESTRRVNLVARKSYQVESRCAVLGSGGYEQFEPSQGPPPVISIPTMPDVITLCRNPFHPFRSNCLWFQPADQPWDGDTSALTLEANPNKAAVRHHMRSREGPLVAVIPHALGSSIPCHKGPVMKISRSKNSKSYGNLTYTIPDTAVRLTTLITILKLSGMSEMTADEVMERFLLRYEKDAASPAAGARKSTTTSSASASASQFKALAEEYKGILAKTAEGSEEREAACTEFALMRLAESPNWSVRWCKRVTAAEYALLEPYQRVNHFPGTWGIGRKDRLHKNLNIAAQRFGREHFGFHPEGWLLPGDADALAKDMKMKRHAPPGQSRNVYIIKRVAGARGARMHLLQKARVPKGTWIAQRYVHDPFLVDGYKFDLRIYVAVTCYDPLRIYVYEEGVVRFATSKYPTNEGHQTDADGGEGRTQNTATDGAKPKSFKIKDVAAHLTNYSINKKSKNFVNPTEGEAKEVHVSNGEGDGDEEDEEDPDDGGSNESSDDDDDDQSSNSVDNDDESGSDCEDDTEERTTRTKGKGGDEKRQKSVLMRSSSKAAPSSISTAERGSKWVISTLRRYLEQRGFDWGSIWSSIEDLIIKTLIAVEPTVANVMRQIFPSVSGLAGGGGGGGDANASSAGGGSFGSAPRLPYSCYSHPAGANVSSCFEVYGFDVLLRQDLSPVLMEVNIMPSLESTASLLDQRAKGNMIADLLTLVGAGFSSRKAYKNRIPTVENPHWSEVLQRIREREKERTKTEAKPGNLPPSTGGSTSRRSFSVSGAAGSFSSLGKGNTGSMPFSQPAPAPIPSPPPSLLSAASRRTAAGQPLRSKSSSTSSTSTAVVATASRRAVMSSPSSSSNTIAAATCSRPSATRISSRAPGSERHLSHSNSAANSRLQVPSRTVAICKNSSSIAKREPATITPRVGGVQKRASSSSTNNSQRRASTTTTGSDSGIRTIDGADHPYPEDEEPKEGITGAGVGGGGPASIYDFHPYFKSRTPAEIDVICTAEEELSRRQHWKRLFPTPTALDTYGRFFPEARAYNVVLSEWEKEKLNNPPFWAASEFGGRLCDGNDVASYDGRADTQLAASRCQAQDNDDRGDEE